MHVKFPCDISDGEMDIHMTQTSCGQCDFLYAYANTFNELKLKSSLDYIFDTGSGRCCTESSSQDRSPINHICKPH